MGIRQTLNENPAVTSAVTGVIILGALFVFYKTSCSGPGGSSGRASEKQYFTIDDGKTYFPDDANKIPPFTKDGKPAYRVKVYKCPDGTKFVSHLERYSDADKKKIEEAMAKTAGMPPDGMMLMANMEVKKPGDKDWVKVTAGPEKFAAIMRPKCPDGSMDVQMVLPQ